MKDLADTISTIKHDLLKAATLSNLSDKHITLLLEACEKIEYAGYGAWVYKSYALNSVAIANRINIESAIELSDMVSLVAIKSSPRTAEILPVTALKVAKKYNNSPDQFNSWMSCIKQVVKLAPESTSAVIEKMDYLLSHLSIPSLERWLLIGVRFAGGDPIKRQAYFSFKDSEAIRWLEHESSSVVFSDIDRELKAYINALWGICVPLCEKHSSSLTERTQRAGFGSGLIITPSSFPGFRCEQANALFYGMVAHIGAHITYSSAPFPIGNLKPLQIALISLIEDARVEHLAMRDFPGLKRLWQPFHVARAKGAQTANSLMVRLSRALIDPNFQDANHWICKAKKIFFERQDDWHNPLISHEIGGLLANDLGQMRIQFNSKTYIVEPPYRDDNMGLWDFKDQNTSESTDAEELFSDIDIQQQVKDDPPEKDHQEQHEIDEGSAKPISLIEEEALPVAHYPEYDYVAERSRPEWTTIIEPTPTLGSVNTINSILKTQAHAINRIKSLITATKISRPQKVHRQSEGDLLDIDACITATISRRAGEEIDPRVYSRVERKHRDLSIHVLLDASESTKDKVAGSTESVLDLERQATVLLAHAMSGLGDPFAISAFCSNKREEVRYYRIKTFEQAYDDRAKSSLAGLAGSGSTRMGAAMRHAAEDLKKQASHRRLLLVVTDGEPSDIDVTDPNYLVEDARHAVQALARDGIDAFCVGLDSSEKNHLTHIFGKRNLVHIDKIEHLPEKLPSLYFRLTT